MGFTTHQLKFSEWGLALNSVELAWEQILCFSDRLNYFVRAPSPNKTDIISHR